jgi:hypothetical protein
MQEDAMQGGSDHPFDSLTDDELLERYRELVTDLEGGTSQVPELPTLSDLEEEIQRRALPLPEAGDHDADGKGSDITDPFPPPIPPA